MGVREGGGREEEEWREGGALPSLLEPGGELQREPRGETDTPESQLSFLLRSPPTFPSLLTSSSFPTILLTSPSFPSLLLTPTFTSSSLLAGMGLPAGDFSPLNLW